MALHKGDDDDRRELAVNPFFGQTDPTGGMPAAPPKHLFHH